MTSLTLAINLVATAPAQTDDNAGRREWAVGVLVKKGVPESIARLAVELGVQAYKQSLAS